MQHFKINAFDIPDGYGKTLRLIKEKGEKFFVSWGSEATWTKKVNFTLEIDHPEHRPLLDFNAPNDWKYVLWYALNYLWETPEDDTSDYTYASRMNKDVKQVDIAIQRFANEPNDRQIVIVIRRPEDIYKYNEDVQMVDFLPVKVQKKHDPPCLSLIDCEIIDHQMHLTCYFRSWDAYAGLPCNIAGIQLFNEAFVDSINEAGYEKRTGHRLTTGKLIFHSKNCHIYQRQYELVEQLLEHKGDSTTDEKQTFAAKLFTTDGNEWVKLKVAQNSSYENQSDKSKGMQKE